MFLSLISIVLYCTLIMGKIIGIFIHNIKDMRSGLKSLKGDVVFGSLGKDSLGKDVYFCEVAKTYDWINDDGYNNFGKWIES